MQRPEAIIPSSTIRLSSRTERGGAASGQSADAAAEDVTSSAVLLSGGWRDPAVHEVGEQLKITRGSILPELLRLPSKRKNRPEGRLCTKLVAGACSDQNLRAQKSHPMRPADLRNIVPQIEMVAEAGDYLNLLFRTAA